ncbi:hypothetical protein GCM10028791_17950 [Echinicola sediminis]
MKENEKKQWVAPEIKQENINVKGGPMANTFEDANYFISS